MYMIITGSGRLGTEFAMRFSCQGHDVVMIDSNPDKLENLGAGFNGKAITGMPFDEDVLQEAGIIHADIVAAVTDDDNVNVMVSQIAKVLYRVPRVITRISTPDKVSTFIRMGFSVICPTIIAADNVEAQLSKTSEV